MAVDSGTYTDDTILRRMKIAEAMLGAPKQPIRHWAEGLAEIGNGLLGGYQFSKAEDAAHAKEDSGNAQLYAMAGLPSPAGTTRESQGGFQKLAALMGGSPYTAPASPAVAPMGALPQAASPASSSPPVAAAPQATPAAASAPGKIYNNDEPSPLDPPSGQDRAAMIATILGEAGNQGPQGMNAVGSVIRNRAVNGGFGGDTPTGVVTAPNQFEPWNTADGRAKMAAAMSDPAQAAAADKAISMAYGEGGQAPNDPTNGAVNFIAPKAQAALGRPMPAWAQGPGQDIGDHRFFGSPQAPYQVAGPPTAAPSTPPQTGAPAVAAAMAPQPSGMFAGVPKEQLPGILSGLTSKNPTLKAIAVQQLGMYQKNADPLHQAQLVNTQLDTKKKQQDLESQGKFGIIGEDQMGRKQYGWTDPSTGKVTPYSPPGNQSSADADLSSLHGEDFFTALNKADPAIATQVRAVVEGRAPYPTGMLLKTPYGQRLAQMVTQADPTFETGNATSRVKVRNEFKAGGVGSPAGQISAGNTALQHAGEMSDALERMKDPASEGMLGKVGESGIPFLSYYANKFHNAAVQGTPEGRAYNDFMTAKNHFSEEVTKFYAGSAGSEAERARALANLDAAKSLPELRSAIKTEANLMQGKVNALQERWRNGMGPLVKDFPLISQESQSAVDRIMKRDAGSGQTQQQSSAIDPGALAEARRRGLIK